MYNTGLISVTAICILLLPAAAAYSDYSIVNGGISSGGGISKAGSYELAGSIGQPISFYSAANQYEVLYGLWVGQSFCTVDLGLFALFAQHWLETGCSDENDWCGGADLGRSGDVTASDLNTFIGNYLFACPSDWLTISPIKDNPTRPPIRQD